MTSGESTRAAGRTLFVGVDHSEHSLRALRHAVQRALEAPGTELVIATAHEPAQEDARTARFQPVARIKADLQAHAQDLLRPAIEIALNSGVGFRTEILTGDVARVLVERAEALDSIGIVLGTRGMGAVGNLMLGSVATKVIHLTRLPVTLVK
jgi:nucleotide-binding universal stress UspA family protein